MRSLTLFFIAFLFASPAFAAPAVDKAGAEALKPRINQTIASIEKKLASKGYKLIRQGDLTVEPAQGYYAITTPSFAVGLPNNLIRVIGMVAINALPTDNPDIFKVALALPTPITDRAASGDVIAKLVFGPQTMNGLWHLGAQTFVQLAANYKDVKYTNSQTSEETVVPNLAITVNLVNDSGTLWSGPSHITAQNITHKIQKAEYTIGTFQLDSTVDKMDLAAEIPVAAPSKNSKNAEGELLFKTLVSRLSNGSSTSVSLNNITMKTVGANNTTQNGTIKNITFNGGFVSTQTETANLQMQASATGISFDDPASQKFVPTEIMFKGNIENIPLKGLTKAKTEAEQKALFAKSSTQMTLERGIIDAAMYGLDATGNYKNINGATSGTLNVSLRGIPELLQWVNGPEAPRMNGQSLVPPAVLGMLTMVQMSGKPGKDAQGRDSLNYELVATPDGKLMLNGADLSAITQGMAPAQQGAKQ